MVQDVTNSLEDWDDFWYNSEDDLPDWTNNLEPPIMEQTNNEIPTLSPEDDNDADLSSYIKEIETQANKPLNVQLNEMKIAGAKLLLSLDKIGKHLDNILKEDKDAESNK